VVPVRLGDASCGAHITRVFDRATRARLMERAVPVIKPARPTAAEQRERAEVNARLALVKTQIKAQLAPR
jgi:hypothetical protein